MKHIPFKVYFGDKTSYLGDPFGCEQLNSGVQVIAQIDERVGWHTVTGHTYYMWDLRGDDKRYKWYGGDFAGLTFYLRRPGPKRVLIGEEIDNDRFDEIFREVMKDRNFAKKTGFLAKERKPSNGHK